MASNRLNENAAFIITAEVITGCNSSARMDVRSPDFYRGITQVCQGVIPEALVGGLSFT